MILGKSSISGILDKIGSTDFAMPFYKDPQNQTTANDYNTNVYLSPFIIPNRRANRDSFFLERPFMPYDRIKQIQAVVCDGTNTPPIISPYTEPYNTIDNGGSMFTDFHSYNYRSEPHAQIVINLWNYLYTIFLQYQNVCEVQFAFTLENSQTGNTTIVRTYPFRRASEMICRHATDFVIIESLYTGDCATIQPLNGLAANIRPFDSLGRAYNRFRDIDATGTERTRQFSNRMLIPATLKELPALDELTTEKIEGVVSSNSVTARYQLVTLLPMPTGAFRELQTILEAGEVTITKVNVNTGETELPYNFIRETAEYVTEANQNLEAVDNDYFVANMILHEPQILLNIECCDGVDQQLLRIVRISNNIENTQSVFDIAYIADGVPAVCRLVNDGLGTDFFQDIPYMNTFVLVSITTQSTRTADNALYYFTVYDNFNSIIIPSPATYQGELQNTSNFDKDVQITEFDYFGNSNVLPNIFVPANSNVPYTFKKTSIYYLRANPAELLFAQITPYVGDNVIIY